MAAKPKAHKTKPRAKPKSSKKAAKPVARHAKTAPASRSGAKKGAQRPKDRASMMAAFSKQVLEEEEAPVAVRSFIEARQGVEKSKELNVKTGEMDPATDDEGTDEPEGDVPEFTSAPAPKLEPLAGPAAVPKRKGEEDFRIAQSSKKGKKPEAPSKDDLGKIELRMQRGSGDATIGRASPDYLQRSFNRAKESGRVAAPPARKTATKDEAFEVAQDKPAPPRDASLLDFGDVEIAQQTRSGRKKLGKLDPDENED